MSGKEQEEVEEDDWSSFMCPQQADTGFRRHEDKILLLSEDGGTKLHIKCVSALSPLDMIDMYNGAQDATGNRIWMGALLFLEALARPLPPVPPQHSIRSLLSNLRERGIRNKRILEMGAGTGISGLSILASQEHSPAQHVTFTDFDAAALDLCRRNCGLNVKDKRRYNIQQLTWGAELPDGMHPESYDTVIATDVLYDISSLSPLMQTASRLLKRDGYFILSHIPRASVQGSDGEGGSAVASAEVLTAVMVGEASKYWLCLEDSSGLGTIKPKELSLLWDGRALNEAAFADMDDVGSAIMVFRKQSSPCHILDDVPVEEGLATEHDGELLGDALPHLVDGRGIPDEGGGHLSSSD